MSDNRIDLCCGCGTELPDPAKHCYVNFRYHIPGTPLEATATLVAVVCNECANQADKKETFAAVEALINAKIIRIEHPEAYFTPKGYLDW